MKLSVNEKPISTSPQDGRTLGTLLDSLRQRGVIGADEVVVGLHVDSRPWTPPDMDAASQAHLADVGEVAVTTGDLREYAGRILADAVGVIGVMQQGARQVADGLRGSQPGAANADLFRLLDALQQLLVCLSSVQNTCHLSQGPLDATGQLLEGLFEGLARMQVSQEKQDWPGLATQIDTSLLPLLEGMGGIVETMRAQL